MSQKVILNFKDEKIGLALASGGFLGSYELGALKYLSERGIDVKDFKSIAGTSVGAVNAASLLANGLEITTDLFLNIKSDDIYNGDLVRVSTKSKIVTMILSLLLKKIYSSPKNIGNIALILRGIIGGQLDNTPLKELLRREISEESIKEILEMDMDIVLCTTEINVLKQIAADKSVLNKDNFIDYIMASSSAYPVFPSYEINGKRYIDGGYIDSNNAKYLFSKFNCDKVVIIDLMDKSKQWENNNNAAYIYPTADLGSFLDTSKKQILKNYNQGYTDAKNYFESNVVIIK